MVVHEVYGLLRDGMAPAVVAEDLVRESNRSHYALIAYENQKIF